MTGNDVIDLDALDTVRGADEGFELQLQAPDGTRLPGRIRIRGYDSTAYRARLDEHNRRRLRNGTAGRVPTPEEIEEDSLEAAAALVMGWTLKLQRGGKMLEYSPQTAAALLREFPWIREQVERAAGRRVNFLPGPSRD